MPQSGRVENPSLLVGLLLYSYPRYKAQVRERTFLDPGKEHTSYSHQVVN